MIKNNLRRKTRIVHVGDVAVGGDNPIRIQSMTNTDTNDVEKSSLQIMQLADAGCEIVRLTTQGIKEAQSLEAIKNILLKKGYNIPLVADVHFFPPAGILAADFVEKVRINPGNYVEGRRKVTQEDFERLMQEKMMPLLDKCKKYKRSLRIGVNHGSLSQRIMERYGNTVEGMVASAIEYTQFCVDNDFFEIIFSMKSSNVKIMMQSYLLLKEELEKRAWNFPFHLGVTEAGFGYDGRAKSSVGIGSLLLAGIGDTIRVSLTEDPVNEIEPCKKLIELTESYEEQDLIDPEINFDMNLSKPIKVFISAKESKFLDKIPANMKSEIDEIITPDKETPIDQLDTKTTADQIFAVTLSSKDNIYWKKIKDVNAKYIIYDFNRSEKKQALLFQQYLKDNSIEIPLVFRFTYSDNLEDIATIAGAEIGSLLCSQIGDGIVLDIPASEKEKADLTFSLLQASQRRITKVEFISCPGCGRTLYNLQEIAQKVKEKTSHLKGIKIAVMGCVVNGPGEMADADFGYIGAGKGKVNLYVNQECVEKDISEDIALDRLIQLIKEKGEWIELIN